MTPSSAPRVGFFTTCLMDTIRPQLGFAAVHLLEQAGCEVIVPRNQTCCGQVAFNSGDRQTTISFARSVIDTFLPYDYLVVPSGSCLSTIQKDFKTLFADDDHWRQRHQQLADTSYELLSFLQDICQFTPRNVAYQGTVAYHHSCSSIRSLGIYQQPLDLLSHVEGVRLVDIPQRDVCCGFGGAFIVKYPEISTAITDDKIHNITATGADTLTGGDLGCLLNLSGRLSRKGSNIKVFHAAEILAGMADQPIFGAPS